MKKIETRTINLTYQNLLENAPAVIYIAVMDENRSFLFVGPQIEVYTGFKAEDFRAEPSLWIKQMHSDDRERVLADFRYAWEKKKPLNLEYRFIRSDSREVWLRDEARVIMDEKGNGLYFQGVLLEVTERKGRETDLKQAVSELEKIMDRPAVQPELKPDPGRAADEFDRADIIFGLGKDYFRSLVNQHFDFLIIISREADVVYAASTTAHFIGYTPDDLKKQKLFSFVHPEDTLKVLDHHNLAIKNPDRVQDFEFRLQGKDNVWHSLSVSLKALVRGPDEIYVAYSCHDITEQKKVDTEHRVLSTAVKQLANGLAVTDTAGEIIFANNAWAMEHGYTLNEIIGRNIGAFHTEEQVIQEVTPFVDKLVKNGVNAGELNHVSRDGVVFPTFTTAVAVRDARGQITGYVYIIRNITENKVLEKRFQDNFQRLQKTLKGTIEAFSLMVEMRDPYTSGHQQRVSELAIRIGLDMHLDEDVIESIRIASAIHDIGKIFVPSEILNKPGRVADIEFTMIKAHAQFGYDILKPIIFPWPLANIVYQHHERMDGSGYPNNLRGGDIMLEARILAVADVVEAMSSFRPYRPARGIEAALDEIRQHRTKLYDPEVVDRCLVLFEKKGFTFGNGGPARSQA